MVVIQKNYANMQSLVRRIFQIGAVVFGFILIFFSVNERMPSSTHLSIGGGGIAHADAVQACDQACGGGLNCDSTDCSDTAGDGACY